MEDSSSDQPWYWLVCVAGSHGVCLTFSCKAPPGAPVHCLLAVMTSAACLSAVHAGLVVYVSATQCLAVTISIKDGGNGTDAPTVCLECQVEVEFRAAGHAGQPPCPCSVSRGQQQPAKSS